MKIKMQDLSREELEKLVLKEKEKNARLRKKCAKLKKDVDWWENGEYYPLLESWRKIYKENEALKKENSFWIKNADFFEKQYESLVKENANLREENINLIIEKADASINKLFRDISQMQDFMKQPFNYN